MTTVINQSSQTVFLEFGGKSHPVPPGESADITVPYYLDGELMMRATGEVDAHVVGEGMRIYEIIFQDKSQIVASPPSEDPPEDEPEWDRPE